MTPTSLPALPLAPAATAPSTASAATQVAPADFLLMLGQLVGANVPASATGTGGSNAPAVSKDGTDDALMPEEAAVDLLGMFPLSLPVIPPSAQVIANSAAQGAAGLDISSITAQGSAAADAQLLSDLLRNDQAVAAESTTDFGSVQLSATMETQQATRTVATEATVHRPVHQPVGSAAWADEIGSRLTVMAEQGKHTASLRLSPEHLGPLEIRIAIRDDQASVWFGAAHADTRAAIETALPRLRELFASTGLSLADTGVFHEPPREHSNPAAHSGTAGGDGQAADEASTVIRRTILGLVDAYA